MPTPKTKTDTPARAAEPQPAPAAPIPPRIPPYTAADIRAKENKAAREARYLERIAEMGRVRGFLDLDSDALQAIDTVMLIRSRVYCGVDGPIEKFITGLLYRYIWAEDRGEGLTVEAVESELEELRENMAEALSEAQFIVERYSFPEASQRHMQRQNLPGFAK